jgi:hypothetical protein
MDAGIKRATFIMATITAASLAGCESDSRDASSASATPEKAMDVEVAPPPAGAPKREARKPRVKAGDFDLEGTAGLIRDDRVKDGKGLEAEINKNPRNRVDVDADGNRDRLQVVERRDGGERTFEVRAMPSSKGRAKAEDVAVPIATIDFVAVGGTARVTVEYAPVVVVDEPVEIVFQAPLVVGSFCHWVLIVERPIFIGVPYVIIHDYHEHKKHKKHKKY